MIHSPPADDFDPMALAFEELNFIRRLGLTPSRWTVGAEAAEQLAARALFVKYPSAVRFPLPCVNHKERHILELFCIPVIVDPNIDPWTVKLSCKETYNPVS